MDILYLRLSKEDGDAEDGSIEESCSIQAQRTCIKQYLRSKGFSVEHFSEIIDDGYSGTTMDRPGMNRLIKLVGSGKVRTIIVRDLSRFARSYWKPDITLSLFFRLIMSGSYPSTISLTAWNWENRPADLTLQYAT